MKADTTRKGMVVGVCDMRKSYSTYVNWVKYYFNTKIAEAFMQSPLSYDAKVDVFTVCGSGLHLDYLDRMLYLIKDYSNYYYLVEESGLRFFPHRSNLNKGV